MNLKNKKVTVVGLGKSGFAAAKFLHAKDAKVRVTDASSKKDVLENAFFLKSLGVEAETGAHSDAFVAGADYVLTSPGVPKKSAPLLAAKKYKIPVLSEVELAARYCEGELIAVTGSNGKTTTCNLLHRILTDQGKKSSLCGNVGYAFLDALSQIDSHTYAVLELSSFQLEDCHEFRPKIAVVLNVSPNHLDRHKSMANYAAAKQRIFHKQKKNDFLILNYDNEWTRRMAVLAKSQVVFFSKEPLKKGIYHKDGKIIARFGNKEKILLGTGNLKLRGSHNMENILACAAVAHVLRLDFDVFQKSVDAFETLEHRIEALGSIRDVWFINDSKSTTLASTQAAIEAVEAPLILIAGGRDKGVDFSLIEPVLLDKVKLVVLYGEAREAMARAWPRYTHFKLQEKFTDAVDLAFALAQAGDSILLSPMCTSFDQFSSFEERGQVFKRHFNTLSGLHGKA